MDAKPRRLSRIAAAARRFASRGERLHRCPACAREFVCPVEWEIDGEEHWTIQLRCGACDTWWERRVTNAEATAFELVLDRQIAAIRRELLGIDRRCMHAELEVLVGALRHDLIDAADFAR